MIDWTSLFFNSLWIIGLSVLLAAFSYHYWQAQLQHRSLKIQLNQSSFLRVMWVGLALICAGLAGTSVRAWETAVWILLVLLCVANLLNLTKT